MKKVLMKILAHLAIKSNRAVSLYRKVCNPGGVEWARYLKAHGGLHAMGEGCYIQTDVVITDPPYTRLGNNVFLTGCMLMGHDASVNLIKQIYGIRGDKVGKVDIRDNVWVGTRALVMPGITIGPNAIVAAGAVVTKDVAPGTVVAGVPAKVICTMDAIAEKTRKEFDALPWRDHPQMQEGASSFPVSDSLNAARIRFFFGE
jgi:acetyltransferase-like isoleucine patch superfamily enzyme